MRNIYVKKKTNIMKLKKHSHQHLKTTKRRKNINIKAKMKAFEWVHGNTNT